MIKPHHSLAQANSNNTAATNANSGFGLGKFVKVQKGAPVIDKYKSQISQQNSSGNVATKPSTTTNLLAKR